MQLGDNLEKSNLFDCKGGIHCNTDLHGFDLLCDYGSLCFFSIV